MIFAKLLTTKLGIFSGLSKGNKTNYIMIFWIGKSFFNNLRKGKFNLIINCIDNDFDFTGFCWVYCNNMYTNYSVLRITWPTFIKRFLLILIGKETGKKATVECAWLCISRYSKRFHKLTTYIVGVFCVAYFEELICKRIQNNVLLYNSYVDDLIVTKPSGIICAIIFILCTKNWLFCIKITIAIRF